MHTPTFFPFLETDDAKEIACLTKTKKKSLNKMFHNIISTTFTFTKWKAIKQFYWYSCSFILFIHSFFKAIIFIFGIFFSLSLCICIFTYFSFTILYVFPPEYTRSVCVTESYQNSHIQRSNKDFDEKDMQILQNKSKKSKKRKISSIFCTDAGSIVNNK